MWVAAAKENLISLATVCAKLSKSNPLPSLTSLSRTPPRLTKHPPNQTVESFLYAFGDDPAPLDETVRVLDSIAKDFIVETCHQAHRAATISGRQKTKTDDFKFAVRGSEEMLGRVQGLLNAERELTDARKQFDTSEGKVGLERAGKKKEKKGKEGKEKDKDKEEEGE